MNKVSVIGAGNVGATAAMKMAINHIADEIVLLDIKDGFAEGKAMDIMQCSYAENFDANVIGVTKDYSATANSDVIVVTSGMARKPGMTREDLVGVNSRIVADVVTMCDKYSPDACYVIVSNPMDTMTLHALNTLKKLHPNQIMDGSVIGMGNLLDSSRFRYFVWKKINEVKPELGVKINDIKNAWVLGGHGDTTMIPVYKNVMVNVNYPTIGSATGRENVEIGLVDILSEEQIADIVDNTMKGGSILTNLLGTSAWEAPAACIAKTVFYILNGSSPAIPCSIYRRDLDCCIGTLTCIGKSYGHYGITAYLAENEEDGDLVEKMKISAEAIKKVNAALPNE